MSENITLFTTDFLTGEKTAHTAICSQLKTGTVKKIFGAIDADALIKESKTTGEFMMNLTAAILVSYPIFEKELLSIFPDITKDDLDNRTTIDDVAGAVADLVLYTLEGLGHIGDKIKKKLALKA